MRIFDLMRVNILKIATLVTCAFLLCVKAYAQTTDKCGFDKTIKAIQLYNPSFADTLEAVRNGKRQQQRALYKTNAAEPGVIPVIFHVVLTKAQLAEIGDTAGVRRRIDSQVAVINRDFNGLNPDSAAIPEPFKAVYGTAGIQFGLAHTRPDGIATPGYEITVTTRTGFDLEGGYNSGFGFSSAKYSASGGVDAWDPDSYLNIWIINPLEDGSVTNILGLCVPAYVATEQNNISAVEKGIVLHYKAFGKRAMFNDIYVPGSDMGRTMTHELGHYFNLLHIWGDDDGKCPATGGDDDGIGDTPPQAYPSSACYIYPKIDGCSKTSPGVMFMNYMDYSFDKCLLLFTQMQAQRMQSILQPGADAYSLTQHPGLLSYPDVATTDKNQYAVYPNPADQYLFISFNRQSEGLKGIWMTDISGRRVYGQEISRQSAFYNIDISGLGGGIYFVVFDFEEGKKTEKVLVY